jgi:hypothetical protein
MPRFDKEELAQVFRRLNVYAAFIYLIRDQRWRPAIEWLGDDNPWDTDTIDALHRVCLIRCGRMWQSYGPHSSRRLVRWPVMPDGKPPAIALSISLDQNGELIRVVLLLPGMEDDQIDATLDKAIKELCAVFACALEPEQTSTPRLLSPGVDPLDGIVTPSGLREAFAIACRECCAFAGFAYLSFDELWRLVIEAYAERSPLALYTIECVNEQCLSKQGRMFPTPIAPGFVPLTSDIHTGDQKAVAMQISLNVEGNLMRLVLLIPEPHPEEADQLWNRIVGKLASTLECTVEHAVTHNFDSLGYFSERCDVTELSKLFHELRVFAVFAFARAGEQWKTVGEWILPNNRLEWHKLVSIKEKAVLNEGRFAMNLPGDTFLHVRDRGSKMRDVNRVVIIPILLKRGSELVRFVMVVPAQTDAEMRAVWQRAMSSLCTLLQCSPDESQATHFKKFM